MLSKRLLSPCPYHSRFVFRPEAVSSSPADADRRPLAALRQLRHAALRRVDARLGLRRARLGPAAQPGDLAADAVGQRLLVAGLVRQERVAGLEQFGVGAVDRQQPVGIDPIDVDHPAGDVLKEVAVVADHDERHRLGLEQRLEPEDRVDVQVVRRLVEQQQVRLADERAGDGQPCLPASGEDAGLDRRIGEPGPAQRDAGPVVVVAGCRGDDPSHGLVGFERRMLGHVADPQALAPRADALVGHLELGEDLQQGRLPGSVRTDQADAIAFVQREGKPLEQRPLAECLADALAVDQEGHLRLVGCRWFTRRDRFADFSAIVNALAIEHPDKVAGIRRPRGIRRSF